MVTDLSSALTDCFTATGNEVFIWNSNSYSCVPNAERGNLVTSKTLFPLHAYPKQGDIINIDGRDFQVLKIANQTIEMTGGGMVPDGPFIDERLNPSLAIFFEPFIRK